MATSKEYMQFIKDQLSGIDGISYHAMMGEYIIYCNEKVIGGLYDNRFLLKPVPEVIPLMKAVSYELPYDGGKEMLAVDDVDDREYLCSLIYTVSNAKAEINRKQAKGKLT